MSFESSKVDSDRIYTSATEEQETVLTTVPATDRDLLLDISDRLDDLENGYKTLTNIVKKTYDLATDTRKHLRALERNAHEILDIMRNGNGSER